jgi:hypothetical protein
MRHVSRQTCLKRKCRTIWNPGNDAEVENARRTFDDLKAKDYEAFRVDDDGDKAGRMPEFDRTAGKVIMVPRLIGG